MAEVLLGVTGGAAAYKACMLGSLLRKAGHGVNGILTASAREFITPVQLSSVTGRPVYTRLFEQERPDFIPHIHLTDRIDIMVVAPATAHFMARAAWGLADDLLTTAFLACRVPVVIAPAMNTRMWDNPAVDRNREVLEGRGVVFAGPVQGELACGTSGMGRMMEPEDVFGICEKLLEGSR